MTPWLTLCCVLLIVFLLPSSCLPVREKVQVPEEFLIKLQSVQNISQFLDRWVNQATPQRSYLLQGDDDGPEAEVARPAACIPEMRVVEFERPYDSSVVMWPSCTRVRRCGGCCSSKLLHCTPTRTSTLIVKVIKARYPHPGAEMLDLEGYDNVQLEQHDRCACLCKQQAHDCSPQQLYQPGQCRCVCKNQHESLRCNSSDRYWDNKDCCCRCRKETDCSTGSYFNKQTCKCERVTSPSILSGILGTVPYHRTVIRDDDESETYRLSYSGIEAHGHVGPFELPHYQHTGISLLVDSLDNETQTHWTEG